MGNRIQITSTVFLISQEHPEYFGTMDTCVCIDTNRALTFMCCTEWKNPIYCISSLFILPIFMCLFLYEKGKAEFPIFHFLSPHQARILIQGWQNQAHHAFIPPGYCKFIHLKYKKGENLPQNILYSLNNTFCWAVSSHNNRKFPYKRKKRLFSGLCSSLGKSK